MRINVCCVARRGAGEARADRRRRSTAEVESRPGLARLRGLAGVDEVELVGLAVMMSTVVDRSPSG